MHALEFLKQPARGGIKPIYAVFGDESYLRREAIGAIARAALGGEAEEDAAISRYAGDRVAAVDVFDELRTLPFLSRCRVVVVEDADAFVTAHRKELETYAAKPSTTGVLILAPKSWPSTTKLAKLVAASGQAIEAKGPSESELPAWLIGLAKSKFGANLGPDAARLLVELVGPEVALLAGEVDKLATYVGDRPTIGRGDVATMVGAGRVEKIWKLVEAAATGQATKALDQLDHLLAAGEHPIKLLGGLNYALRPLHHAGMLRMARVPDAEACKRAGIPSFPAAVQAALRQHAHLGPARVAALPDRLLKVDLDLKGSSILDPRSVLERFLLWLARPREEATR